MILLCPFRRISTKPAKKLLESLLKEENVPVLVCLTHVDRLYVEYIDKDVNNDCTPLPTEYKKRVIGHELTVSVYLEFCMLPSSDHNNDTVLFTV